MYMWKEAGKREQVGGGWDRRAQAGGGPLPPLPAPTPTSTSSFLYLQQHSAYLQHGGVCVLKTVYLTKT